VRLSKLLSQAIADYLQIRPDQRVSRWLRSRLVLVEFPVIFGMDALPDFSAVMTFSRPEDQTKS
jgi:hypothetical protein